MSSADLAARFLSGHWTVYAESGLFLFGLAILMRKAQSEFITKLRADAKIERMDKPAASAAPTMPAPPAAVPPAPPPADKPAETK